jgi:hypothetical protein
LRERGEVGMCWNGTHNFNCNAELDCLILRMNQASVCCYGLAMPPAFLPTRWRAFCDLPATLACDACCAAEITQIALAQRLLLSIKGQTTSKATMASALSTDVRRRGSGSVFIK